MALRRRLRGWLFELLYSRLATHYDRVSAAAFAGEWERWAAVGQRLADAEPIFELGCGTGATLGGLLAAGRRAWGIEPSPAMLARARCRVAGHLIRARAQQLPLRDASVGTLLSLFPTAYILDPITWAEAARVLRPGGRVIVVGHGWLAPRDPWRWFLVLLHRIVYGGWVGAPAELPAGRLRCVALVERTAHGFVAVYVATKPRS